jgi:SAM-dependent methyltransferase
MLDKIKKMMKKDNTTVKTEDTVDTSYLENSAEAVGYDNRELQWNVYKTVLQYIPDNSSILDFGCGRGDLYAMHKAEYGELNYVGIDFNEPLINAGKKIYTEISDNLILSDWFKLPTNLAPCDWCVSIGSNNLRYDANTKLNDFDYTIKTIDVMYKHATQGIVILLTSGKLANGLISHDAGKLLNWCQRKYGNTILDHSVSESGFCLIIKKI